MITHTSTLLIQFFKKYRDIMVKHAKEKSITFPQMITLQQIYKEPKTIGQIVEAVQLSYSTVSGIIDRLERDGWIERVKDRQDRRIIWIRKTAKFEEGIQEIMSFQRNFNLELLRGLSERELEVVTESLELLTKQIGQIEGRFKGQDEA